MKIDEVLSRHPWPWTFECPIIGMWGIYDANNWRILVIAETDRKRTIDVVESLLGMVSEHVAAAGRKAQGEASKAKP